MVKLPIALRSVRARGALAPLREDLVYTRPEPADADGLVPSAPAAATITRRGLLGLVGGASALLFVGSRVGGATTIALWLAGAVVAHDLLLLPLYSGADRLLGRRSWVNFVRVPAALSLVTLLAFAPLILGRGDAVLDRISTVDPSGYAVRWLGLTAALFAVSGIVWLLRRRTGRHRAGGRTRRIRSSSSETGDP